MSNVERMLDSEAGFWFAMAFAEPTLVNLTGDVVTVRTKKDGRPRYTAIRPTGEAQVVRRDQKELGFVRGISVIKTKRTIDGLPPQTPGTVYIVPEEVRNAITGRPDVVTPDTGETAYKSPEGRIVAVTRFRQ